MHRLLIAAVTVAFLATIVAANWALDTFGVVTVLGLAAPAGVFFAGLGFLLRDLLHELGGRRWVLGAIVVGAFLSYALGADTAIPGGHVSIAVASGCAFLFSELADSSVYEPLRRRTVVGGILASQVVGAAVDSALFLYLAFGSFAFFWGQFALKTLMVLPALAVLALYRARLRAPASYYPVGS